MRRKEISTYSAILLASADRCTALAGAVAAPNDRVAFAEDRTIIEAQQRVIDAAPIPRIMPIGADRGVTLWNLMVDKLVKAENAPLRQVS